MAAQRMRVGIDGTVGSTARRAGWAQVRCANATQETACDAGSCGGPIYVGEDYWFHEEDALAACSVPCRREIDWQRLEVDR